MTRSKVKLELIKDNSKRKQTYKKRKAGLLKKAEELSTLCDVDACAIICSPYEEKPVLWPNGPGAQRVLSRFDNLSMEDQGKKMLDQESYLRQRIDKAKQQLDKLRKEEREREISDLMYGILNGERVLEGLNLNDTKELYAMAQSKLDLVEKTIEKHNNNNNSGNGDSA